MIHYTMEYYLAIKRKELLVHATTWMNLQELYWLKEANTKILHTTWLQFYSIAFLKWKNMQKWRTDQQLSGLRLSVPGWKVGLGKMRLQCRSDIVSYLDCGGGYTNRYTWKFSYPKNTHTHGSVHVKLGKSKHSNRLQHVSFLDVVLRDAFILLEWMEGK